MFSETVESSVAVPSEVDELTVAEGASSSVSNPTEEFDPILKVGRFQDVPQIRIRKLEDFKMLRKCHFSKNESN